MKNRSRECRFFRDDTGASAVEYALIVALIAVVIIVAVALFGHAVSGLFASSCTAVASAASGTC